MSGRGQRGRGGGGRGGRGGRIAPGMRPVTESTRLDITASLAEFQASDETELVFPPGLSNHDRAVVHAECKKYGFTSKSYGKGEGRQVHVFKRRQRTQEEPIFELPLGDASQAALAGYFAAHPPTEAELEAAAAGLDAAYGSGAAEGGDEGGHGAEDGADNDKKSRSGGSKKRGRSAAEFDAAEIERRRRHWETAIASPGLQDTLEARQNLPIADYRDEIVSAVRSNQVILIAGETGCGKTTQVPQFLLEDAWVREEGCRVICTQPRRISAMSVAERVAAERGESVGDNVGYTIRLESRGGPESSLMFCTNGVLLRMLTDRASDAMAAVTHLVIDEIHERDRFADFLLILVRDLLPSHPSLRVILMSATLHIELFSGYFGGCPVVSVPGFTHPVTDFYLEDVLKLTGYQEKAVQEVNAELGRGGGGAAALVGLGGGAAAEASVSPEERARVEAAIETAFRTGSDEAFEVLMEVTGAAGADDSSGGSPCVNLRHSVTGATALVAAAFHGRADVASVLLANGADPAVAVTIGGAAMTARDLAAQCGRTDVVELLEEWEAQRGAAEEIASSALALSHYQANTDADEVDLDMILALLEYICGEGKFAGAGGAGGAGNGADKAPAIQGAVLVFFPGWDEIIRMKEKLEASPAFGRAGRYLVLPLHSQVAPGEQRRVFARPPAGARKIVLSTNMAETAITIDDVVCVIDSGRLKEKSYDAYTGVSTLQGAWISKASERQRRGRAGRCQPGVAFHMYSRARSEALAEFQLPELKRSPLDEMGLQVKLLETPGAPPVSIAGFLAKAVEPPVPQAVDAAVALLCDIGALDAAERLTSLGRHLAALPLPPALGKMLLYGVLFNCLDPVLTVACCMAYRDPWVLPAAPGGRAAAALLRGQWSTEAGGSSDHLATVRAFNGWVAAKSRGGDHGYCLQNFLSPGTMRMVDGMRGQLLGELVGRGFVASLEAASGNAHRADLVRAVLGCGFYPMIGRLLPTPRRDPKAQTKVMIRNGDRVRIHQASVNYKLRVEGTARGEGDYDDGDGPPPPEFAALLFFDEITRGEAGLYIKSCTAMHPHPAALVAASVVPAADAAAVGDDGDGVAEGMGGMQLGEGGGALDNDEAEMLAALGVGAAEAEPSGARGTAGPPDTGLLVVDGWLKFRVPIQNVAQLSCLRVRVAAAFAAKVRRPRAALPPALQAALDVAAAVFNNESESADGVETDLGTTFTAGRGGRGFRGGRGGGQHHLFRYSHHAPAAHRGGYSGGGAAPRGGRGGAGRFGGGGRGGAPPPGLAQPQRQQSQPYRGPYAPSSGAGGEFHAGVKRSHSGNPRNWQQQQFQQQGRGGGSGGGGGGRYGGGRGRYDGGYQQGGGGGRGGGRRGGNRGRGRGSGGY